MEEVIPSMVSTQENGVYLNFSCKYPFSCTIWQSWLVGGDSRLPPIPCTLVGHSWPNERSCLASGELGLEDEEICPLAFTENDWLTWVGPYDMSARSDAMCKDFVSRLPWRRILNFISPCVKFLVGLSGFCPMDCALFSVSLITCLFSILELIDFWAPEAWKMMIIRLIAQNFIRYMEASLIN